MRILIFGLAVLVSLASVSGCQTSVSRKDAINVALYSYEKALRWVGPSEAYGFLRDDLQPPYLPANIDRFSVVGYTVMAPPVEIQEDVVVQTVKIRYVNSDTQVMRELMDEQVWETEDGKNWKRTNPIPDFR